MKIHINENIEIYQGDCLEIMPTLEEVGSVDMILCDLPYGFTANKWDGVIPLIPLWTQYNRLAKSNAAIVLFGSDKYAARLSLSNENAHKYNLIWRKTSPTGHLNAKKMPLRSHEQICVFYYKQPTYNPQKTYGHPRKVSSATHKRNSVKTENYRAHGLTGYDSTERYPTSVLTFPSDKQNSSLHPTQKPIALMEYLIKTYTNEGETVLDNCMGSGTTGVACINADRKFIGIEKDPTYFEIAEKRMREQLKKQANT